MIKKTLIVMTLAILLTSPSWAAQKQPKIGILNIQKILAESEVGKKTRDELAAKQKKLQERFDKKQAEAETLRQDIEKKGAVLSKEAREEKEREYQKQLRDLRQIYEDAQYEMQQAQNNAFEPVLKSLQDIVQEFGQKQGYTLILDPVRGGVLYVPKETDVTDEILDLFNKKSKLKK